MLTTQKTNKRSAVQPVTISSIVWGLRQHRHANGVQGGQPVADQLKIDRLMAVRPLITLAHQRIQTQLQSLFGSYEAAAILFSQENNLSFRKPF